MRYRSAQYQPQGFAIEVMLLFQNAGRKRLHRVVIQHRHRRLHDDRAGVQVLIHEMHRAAGDLDAVFERLMLRIQAGKRRQQRRMNVQNAVRKLADERARSAGA